MYYFESILGTSVQNVFLAFLCKQTRDQHQSCAHNTHNDPSSSLICLSLPLRLHLLSSDPVISRSGACAKPNALAHIGKSRHSVGPQTSYDYMPIYDRHRYYMFLRSHKSSQTISHGLARLFAKVRARNSRGTPKGLTSCQVVSGGVNEPHVG